MQIVDLKQLLFYSYQVIKPIYSGFELIMTSDCSAVYFNREKKNESIKIHKTS
jgi:hypothetical protein